jgi:4-hydroxy-3-methylbut-2-enyl diphosphate reductase
MNRSVERRKFGIIGTVPGEILVGRLYLHPARGPVHCPAAPLVAAGARRAGHRVRETSRLHLAACDDDGVLFAASYLDRDGRAIGLAAAAHHTDEAGLAAAHELIMTWSAVWRTRRVVVADVRGACAGARYAHEPAGSTPVPTPRRTGSLPDVREHTSGDRTTLRPAVGALVRAPGSAQGTGVPVVDAVCPHVARAHAEAQRFADRGDHVVVIGRRGHAEASALLARAPGCGVVVESEEDVAALRLPADRVSFVVQPGMVLEQAMAVIAGLRRRYPSLRGAHPDHLCYAASDHLETIRLVAGTSDRTILLGDPDLTTLCALTASTVEVVRDPVVLRPAWLAGAECVGVVPVGPSGEQLTSQLVGLLSGLGPLSVVRRRVTTGFDAVEGQEMSNSPRS